MPHVGDESAGTGTLIPAFVVAGEKRVVMAGHILRLPQPPVGW